GRAGAIAVKHSARAPTETPRRQMPRQMHARDLSVARTCSLRCELVTWTHLAQEISTNLWWLTFIATKSQSADWSRQLRSIFRPSRSRKLPVPLQLLF